MIVIERVMGLEPTDGTLGRYCLTTWLHPLVESIFHTFIIFEDPAIEKEYFFETILEKKRIADP